MISAAPTLDGIIADFAEPSLRQAASKRLAGNLGGSELMMLARDPELGIMLPAPGFPQTLRDARAWHAFVDECVAAGELAGSLPTDRGREPAHGLAVPGCVAVLLGAASPETDLSSLRPLLQLLGALFQQERRAESADVRISTARQDAERAAALARTVQAMHAKLQDALSDAHAARLDASARTAEAESLAEELRVQTAHLEEQAAELQTLNEELAQRTQDAVQARREAETADRAKSEFLASMSHELRTPINAIIGYAELLDMGIGGELSTEQRHHVERVRASSRHLLTLINDVLDLAKIEAGHMTVEHRKARIGPAITDAVSLLAIQADEKGLHLVDECAGTELSYFGDQDRVRQILANLLSNAVKFTEDGGTITVRCGSEDTPPPETHVDGDGPWTYVDVEDTGIGMSEEEAAAVFQPFVQATAGRTRAHGGTGLGLTISRQLARLMGGDLTLRTASGAGTCLTLWLPGSAPRSGSLDESIRVGAAS